MISKELFVETINFMKERNDTVDRINREISVEFEDSVFIHILDMKKCLSRF